jgi:hypothetical protein
MLFEIMLLYLILSLHLLLSDLCLCELIKSDVLGLNSLLLLRSSYKSS